MPNIPARVFRINPNRNRKLEHSLLLVAFAPLVMMALFGFQHELLGKLFEDPVFVILLLMMPLSLGFGAWADRRISKRARLTIDSRGLRLQNGLGPAISRGIECGWGEIAKVVVIERLGVVQIRRDRFGAAPLALRITDWVEDFPDATPAPPKLAPSAMRTTALWKILEEAGLFSEKYAKGGMEAFDFDLAKHPATKAALAVLSGLFLYGAVDSLLRREAWVDLNLEYLTPHLIVGGGFALAGLFAFKLARKPAAIPNQVAIPLAGFVGLAAIFASWSFLVRVNQYFAGPLEERAYVRNAACDTLVPVDSGLPPIEYTELAREYWCQFPVDQRHPVPIRKGFWGLYQVDLTQHTDAIRTFRQARGKFN